MDFTGQILGTRPERCANALCEARSFEIVRVGFTSPVECLQGKRRQRFKCRVCSRSFTENFFKVHYRLRHKDPSLNYWIFIYFVHGMPLRRIAKLLRISVHSTRIRINRMAKRALEFQLDVSSELRISEPICIDGLENFARSQYEPNNVNHAIGQDSLFTYDVNYACLNRKGRTSSHQKIRLSEIESVEGRFDPQAIRKSFGELVRRLNGRRKDKTKPLVVLSDEHFQYRRAIKYDLRDIEIEHGTISSKVARNFQNILFSVNHSDLVIRKTIAPFARETISFSKTHGMMMQKYGLYVVFKNYMQSQFTKKQKRRPRAHIESPAMALGIFERILDFEDIFSERSVSAVGEKWSEDWRAFWHGQVPEIYHRSKKFVREKYKYQVA